MPRSRTGAGRHGALDESRELVALVSSLSEAGDALSVEAVSARLGVSTERARKLLSLVMSSSVGDDAGLPLVEDGEDEVSLLRDEGMRGRAVRLTRAEALALAAALDRIGVGRDDPAREAVEAALFSSPVDGRQVERLLGAGTAPSGEALAACATAIYERRALTFRYRGAADGAEARRTVLPRGLRSEEDSWYLDAWDLDRRGERTFRLDRMSGAAPAPAPGTRADAGKAGQSAAREVRVTFADERFLTLLPWHGLTVEGRGEDGLVRARVAYYGGDWLVRMLAACGGTATTDDPELAARVRAYASALLAGR